MPTSDRLILKGFGKRVLQQLPGIMVRKIFAFRISHLLSLVMVANSDSYFDYRNVKWYGEKNVSLSQYLRH